MKRITPQQLVIGLGVAIALFTIGSGIAPGITGFEEESTIHREVFGNIPDALKVAFYTVIPALLVYGAVLFSFRVKNWQRGAPDDRSTNAGNLKRRLGDFRAGVYMQTLLRDPVAGVMHSLIYFGFLVLLVFGLQVARILSRVARGGLIARLKMAEIPRNGNPTRIRNRCELTGRPRAYYRKFRLCRIQLRDLANKGLIPGVVKSSW